MRSTHLDNILFGISFSCIRLERQDGGSVVMAEGVGGVSAVVLSLVDVLPEVVVVGFAVVV
jgi:hypothetical protein